MVIVAYIASILLVLLWFGLGGSDGNIDLILIIAMYLSLIAAITEVRDKVE